MYQTGYDLVLSSYRKAMQESEARRKDEASKMLDYYCNGQLDYIAEDIRKTIERDDIVPLGLNIVHKVIRNLAMVYIQDAVRVVDGSDQDKAILSEIETSTAMPVKMKQANRLSKLLGTILLRPVWRNGQMDLDVLTPDVLDVQTGDTPEDLRSVLVTHYAPDGDINAISFSLWTPELVRTLDAMGRVKSEEPNPYGILPFVPCWANPVSDYFWQRGARDLIMAQDGINRLLTLIGYVIDFQGFSLCYVKGDGAQKFGDNAKIGPGRLLGLPEKGEVGFVSPQAPIDEVLKAIDFLIRRAAMLNGLPAAMMSTEEKEQSGVARIVGNRELEELRADDIALFTEYERRLFDVFRIVWNTHNPGRQISGSAVFQINFYDPKPSMTATEQAALWEKLLGMGILSPVDIIMERDPDLTRDEAKARLIQIHDEIKEFQQI